MDLTLSLIWQVSMGGPKVVHPWALVSVVKGLGLEWTWMKWEMVWGHWSEVECLLAWFDFVMHHKPGKSIGKPDALSHWADHGSGSGDNENMILLTPDHFAIHALQGLEVIGEEQDILKDIWKGVQNAEK